MGFHLTIAKGPQAGRALALTRAEVRIGRGAENDLVLGDPGVSRRHACIFERDGRYLVQDVGSANGTAVNDEPLQQVRELAEGDRICVGAVELLFAHAPHERTRILGAGEVRPRREASGTLGGQLRLAWEGLGRRERSLAGGLALAALLGMVGTLVALVQPREAGGVALGPEPTVLTATPLRGAFGLGEGVTWTRPDMKVFSFEFTSPTRAVALLRYRAHGISNEEVSVSVNGREQGWVPPDAGGSSSERELELVLPPSVLERNAPNQLIFDNVRNPPGREAWRIEGLRVEIIPVPELGPAELLASARESVAKARIYEQQRAVGSENLFRAWKNYRFAWVTLEALDERPELYRDVRHALGQVSADLDRECARLMLELQRGVQYRDRAAARQAFEDVLRHFPTTEHRCHTLALEQRSRYAL